MIYAPKFPLKFKERKMFENVKDTKELVAFHIKNLMLTNPGEKISDPEYGVGITKLLFENMTETTFNMWEDRTTKMITKYISYINLNEVVIEPFFEQNKIGLKIIYNLLNDTEKQLLELTISLENLGSSSPVY